MSEEVAKKNNYPGNTHRSKEAPAPTPEKEPVKRIEGLNAVARKKPLSRKIAETFSGDDAQSVGQYVLFDVILPSVKDMIFDAVKEGLQRALYSGGGKARTGNNRASGSQVNYRGFHSSSVAGTSSSSSRVLSSRARANHDFREIILDTRGQAEEAMDGLSNLIEKYDVASVADLYSMVGITGEFTDNKWGWASLNGARVVHVRDGYLLDLPPTIELD